MKQIFEEVRLNRLTLKNRLVRSATWEGIADEAGHLNGALFAIYEELFKGGVGVVITGFTSVSADDQYFGGMVRLSDDALIAEHRRLTRLAHEKNCPVIAQIALGEYNRVSPDGAVTARDIEIDDLTESDIGRIIALFVSAAGRADKAGYDGVQIHAAHFFFLSRFVSPAVNHRTDKWGGSAENRTRIVAEIADKIRAACPNLHISMKVNSDDFTAGGLDNEESLALCKILAPHLDSIEVSGNGTSVGGIRAGVNEAYFAPFASRLASEVNTPVICVGGFRSRAAMEAVLNKSDIALISLSRPLVREPDFPRKLQSGESDVSKCVSCNMCYRTPAHRCVFNKSEAYR